MTIRYAMPIAEREANPSGPPPLTGEAKIEEARFSGPPVVQGWSEEDA